MTSSDEEASASSSSRHELTPQLMTIFDSLYPNYNPDPILESLIADWNIWYAPFPWTALKSVGTWLAIASMPRPPYVPECNAKMKTILSFWQTVDSFFPDLSAELLQDVSTVKPAVDVVNTTSVLSSASDSQAVSVRVSPEQFILSLSSSTAEKSDELLREMERCVAELKSLEPRVAQRHQELMAAMQVHFHEQSYAVAQRQMDRETELSYISLLVEKDEIEQAKEDAALKAVATTASTEPSAEPSPRKSTSSQRKSRLQSCHQCLLSERVVALLVKCQECPRVYCSTCLRKVYGIRNMPPEDVGLKKCPHCKNNCFCEIGLAHRNVKKLHDIWLSRDTIGGKLSTTTVGSKSRCNVCDARERTDEMLKCNSCGVRAHEKCLIPETKVIRLASQPWYCDPCRLRNSVIAPKLPDLHSLNPSKCALCPVQDSMLLQYIQPKGELQVFLKESKAAEAVMVHPLCHFWLKVSHRHPFDIISSKVCAICNKKTGLKIKCSVESCDAWLHASCAKSSGLKMIVGEAEAPTLYCVEHSPIENRMPEFLRLKNLRYDLEQVRMMTSLVVSREKRKRAAMEVDFNIIEHNIRKAMSQEHKRCLVKKPKVKYNGPKRPRGRPRLVPLVAASPGSSSSTTSKTVTPAQKKQPTVVKPAKTPVRSSKQIAVSSTASVLLLAPGVVNNNKTNGKKNCNE